MPKETTNTLICWCEDCEEKFDYDISLKHDTHEIYKLYELDVNGRKVKEVKK